MIHIDSRLVVRTMLLCAALGTWACGGETAPDEPSGGGGQAGQGGAGEGGGQPLECLIGTGTFTGTLDNTEINRQSCVTGETYENINNSRYEVFSFEDNAAVVFAGRGTTAKPVSMALFVDDGRWYCGGVGSDRDADAFQLSNVTAEGACMPTQDRFAFEGKDFSGNLSGRAVEGTAFTSAAECEGRVCTFTMKDLNLGGSGLMVILLAEDPAEDGGSVAIHNATFALTDGDFNASTKYCASGGFLTLDGAGRFVSGSFTGVGSFTCSGPPAGEVNIAVSSE